MVEGGRTDDVVAGSDDGRALIGDTSGGGGGGCGLAEALVGVTWGDVMETGEGGLHGGDMECSGDGLMGRWNESGC